ncbi:MAG TPA: carboxypeptidase-like regulatory domain-containing protein, partial [Pyrinomonadaceae bacterium]
MRVFTLKIFLCFSGLLFGFAVLTETAFLQDTPPRAVNTANAANTAATPRPKKKGSANTNATVGRQDAKTVSNMSINAVQPAPVPDNSTVRGRVFYADTGRAVKRAPIMLMREKGSGGPGNMATGLTDNDGNFRMKNVQAGVYYAMVNAPGVVSPLAYVDFSMLRSGGVSESEEFEKATEGFEKIVVDGITDIDVEIPARRGGAVGGRVMYDNGDPAVGIKVEILRKANNKFLPVVPNFGAIFSMMTGGGGHQTDDRGVYRFAGLPAGEYIVKVTENVSHGDAGGKKYYNEFEFMFGTGNSLLSMFYPDVFEPKAASIINVELGQEITEINLTIPSRSLYKIEGKIVSRKDKSPVKARISIKREGDEDAYSIFGEIGVKEQSSVTDEKGNWNFKELPKGNYKLVVEPIQSEETNYGEVLDDYYSNTNTWANARKNTPSPPKFAKKIQEIKLEDKDLSEVVIELGAGATITGTILVENNGDMPKSVTVHTISEANELASSDTVLGASALSGDQNPQTPDKDFRLENIAEGKTFFYVHHDENYYVKSARAGGVDLLGGALDLKDGETIANVQIVLSKDVGEVKGKILDDKNEPLKNG